MPKRGKLLRRRARSPTDHTPYPGHGVRCILTSKLPSQLGSRLQYSYLTHFRSGLLRIRNEPSCDYNWRRTASEEVLDTPGLTDDLPLADGDLRIHVSPAGMQVWAVGVDMWDDQRAWTLAKEGQAHPTLDDYVLTFLGDRYMPRWVKRHTYATYKSNHKAARK